MDHVRIDEGVKRPKNPHRPPVRHTDSGITSMPANLNANEVLERYLTESTTSQIAASYGVSRKTLVRWLVATCPNEWRQVQVIRALCKKEDGDEGIETACDALALARAREQLRSGQWDLERLDSANYGPKQEISIDVHLDLGERLRRSSERVVSEQQPEQRELPTKEAIPLLSRNTDSD